MMKYIIFAFLLGILLPSTSSLRRSFYRTDYTYFENFNAFYKVHWDDGAPSWKTAFIACADEGATLFYPKAEGEWTLVKNMTDSVPDVLNVTEIFVGFHDEFKLGVFITVDGKFYRKDYAYIDQFDAFYKVHRDVSGSAWSTALFTYDDEGATLFYSKVEEEWALVKNLTDKMTKLPNVTDIFVGLHDEFNLGEFIAVDGYPSTLPSDSSLLQEHCITMNIYTGLLKASSCLRTPQTSLPFVCKKVDDESCPTIDRGYKYAEASKKCYKVNEKPLMWRNAMKTCFLEGGILAVVEDSAQVQDVIPMLKLGASYFVGVRQLDNNGEFYTLKGQKISEIYQSQNPYQPPGFGEYGTVVNQDNHLYTGKEEGIITLPLICEMKVAN